MPPPACEEFSRKGAAMEKNTGPQAAQRGPDSIISLGSEKEEWMEFVHTDLRENASKSHPLIQFPEASGGRI